MISGVFECPVEQHVAACGQEGHLVDRRHATHVPERKESVSVHQQELGFLKSPVFRSFFRAKWFMWQIKIAFFYSIIYTMIVVQNLITNY